MTQVARRAQKYSNSSMTFLNCAGLRVLGRCHHVFNYVDHLLYVALERWGKRRHPNKNRHWEKSGILSAWR